MNEENETPGLPADDVPPSAEPAPEPAAEPAPAAEVPAAPASTKKWYVVKVQSGREDSIRQNLERRVKLQNLEYVSRVVVSREDHRVGTANGIKKVKSSRAACSARSSSANTSSPVQETGGIGDFVGGSPDKPPLPMATLQRMLATGRLPAPRAKGKEGRGRPAATKRIKLD